jgi:cytochrome oxidase Cu insertion factor (SCO1/SenC/PrrC family)
MMESRRRRRGFLGLVSAGLLAASLGAHAETPLFTPPAPGTYELPPIQHVADYELLDSHGARVRLLGLAPGQVALVSFVYQHCTDGSACPAALATWKRVDEALAARPTLARHVRLVTVSFDPANDTPERMAELGRHLRPRSDWRFLTARSEAELQPVLADYGQDVLRLVGSGGERLGLIQHLTKAFLVDAHGNVRGIYGSSFLSPQILLNDVQTVLAEESAARRQTAASR